MQEILRDYEKSIIGNNSTAQRKLKIQELINRYEKYELEGVNQKIYYKNFQESTNNLKQQNIRLVKTNIESGDLKTQEKDIVVIKLQITSEEKEACKQMVDLWNKVFEYSIDPIKAYRNKINDPKLVRIYKTIFNSCVNKKVKIHHYRHAKVHQ